MGLPMVQVFMIAARQISRPIADRVLKYGRTHALFRNRILVPLGRGLAHLSTRLRMKYLGLGRPASIAPVSEETALEQASDFVQQVVLFSYSVGVFAGYYFYTKCTTPETVKCDTFERFVKENETKLEDINRRLERIEKLLLNHPSSANTPPHNTASECDNKGSNGKTDEQCSTTTARPRFKRISSLPIDEAAKVVLSGSEQYVIARRGTSLSIEPLEIVLLRGEPFKFRHKPPSASSDQDSCLFINAANRSVSHILGDQHHVENHHEDDHS